MKSTGRLADIEFLFGIKPDAAGVGLANSLTTKHLQSPIPTAARQCEIQKPFAPFNGVPFNGAPFNGAPFNGALYIMVRYI